MDASLIYLEEVKQGKLNHLRPMMAPSFSPIPKLAQLMTIYGITGLGPSKITKATRPHPACRDDTGSCLALGDCELSAGCVETWVGWSWEREL